jgi:Flp pilus assembly pilin Flp
MVRGSVSMLTMFRGDDTGATAIEYSLTVALTAVAIIAAVTSAGARTHSTLNSVASNLR